MKIKHKQKVKKARKMLSNDEKRMKVGIFQSKQWTTWKEGIKNYINNKIKKNGRNKK